MEPPDLGQQREDRRQGAEDEHGERGEPQRHHELRADEVAAQQLADRGALLDLLDRPDRAGDALALGEHDPHTGAAGLRRRRAHDGDVARGHRPGRDVPVVDRRPLHRYPDHAGGRRRPGVDHRQHGGGRLGEVGAGRVDGVGSRVDGARVDGARVDGARVDGARVDGARVVRRRRRPCPRPRRRHRRSRRSGCSRPAARARHRQRRRRRRRRPRRRRRSPPDLCPAAA